MRWHVVIDADRCSGIGLCEALAPDVLEVGDDGRVHALQDSFGDDARRDQATAAAQNCPTRSLHVARMNTD